MEYVSCGCATRSGWRFLVSTIRRNFLFVNVKIITTFLIDGTQYLDGGLKCNNPSLEAVKLIPDLANATVVSIGTGKLKELEITVDHPNVSRSLVGQIFMGINGNAAEFVDMLLNQVIADLIQFPYHTVN